MKQNNKKLCNENNIKAISNLNNKKTNGTNIKIVINLMFGKSQNEEIIINDYNNIHKVVEALCVKYSKFKIYYIELNYMQKLSITKKINEQVKDYLSLQI